MTKHEKAVLDLCSRRMDKLIRDGRYGRSDAAVLKEYKRHRTVSAKLVCAVAAWRIASGKARTGDTRDASP